MHSLPHLVAHNADNLDLPSDDMNHCLLNNQIIEENDEDKQSISSPEVEIFTIIFYAKRLTE